VNIEDLWMALRYAKTFSPRKHEILNAQRRRLRRVSKKFILYFFRVFVINLSYLVPACPD
jgi:predicted nucleic acid-binding Zn ribbon protein